MPRITFESKEQAAKALLTLYGRQEPEEQSAQTTIVQNQIGFNGIDAGFASSVAEWILAGKPLTNGQFKVLQRILPKYSRQLEEAQYLSYPIPATAVAIEPSSSPPGRLNPSIDRKYAGKLQLGNNNRLEFYPYIYPSKQIKPLGFEWLKPVWVTHKFSLGIVKQVIRLFGEVEIDPEVQALIDQVESREKIDLNRAEHKPLFPFQKEAIQFLHSSPRSMLALAPGLGKTACSIFAANSIDDIKHILVISPLSLLYNWQKEVQKWINQPASIWHGSPDTWRVPSKDFRWVITNYDTAVRHLDTMKKIKWDILIIDESVLVKNRKAQRTQKIKELSGETGIVWELSGAPTTRFYDDMWSQLNILDADRFRSYWRFAKSYCIVTDNGWGLQIDGNKPDAPERIQEDLSDMYFCRTQDQVLDLPDWIIDTIYVPLEGSQLDIYKQMEQEFLANLPEGEVVLLAPNILAQITRLIQIASNPALLEEGTKQEFQLGAKWLAVEDLLQFESLPAIIWTNFIKTANELTRWLQEAGYRVACLTGSSPDWLRQQIVEEFQSGKIDVLIAHPGVGKFGLTLTAARTAIYLERSFNGDDYYQSLHRIRRIGTSHSPHVIHLLAEGENGAPTIDHVIDRVLAYRKKQNFKLTTGDIRTTLERNDL